MKIRTGFVSNSSSSSFVIKKQDLTDLQILKIYDYLNEAKILGLHISDEYWEISEDEYNIKGWTFMDNFDMAEFFDRIGISNLIVEWSD